MRDAQLYTYYRAFWFSLVAWKQHLTSETEVVSWKLQITRACHKIFDWIFDMMWWTLRDFPHSLSFSLPLSLLLSILHLIYQYFTTKRQLFILHSRNSRENRLHNNSSHLFTIRFTLVRTHHKSSVYFSLQSTKKEFILHHFRFQNLDILQACSGIIED